MPVLASVAGLGGRVCKICGTWAADDEWERVIEKKARALAAPKPAKIGRNDPCYCGSGKKYKKCCGGH